MTSLLKKIIVAFLFSPEYCNCVSYKIYSLASFYFISFEEKRGELNSLLFRSDLMYHSSISIIKKASQNVIYDMFCHCFIGSRIGGIGENQLD